MRKTSTDLHQLIRSLTKEEKRKITIRIQELGKKGIDHLRFFKMIAQQEIYNEVPLKKLFRGSALSSEKKRLYQLIMEALVEFHNDSEIYHQLLTGLQQFHILYDKGLYEQAKSKIYKLKEFAQKHESLYCLQLINEQIVRLEHKVYFFTDFTDESVQSFVNEIKLQQNQTNNLCHYTLLKSQMHFFFRKKKVSKHCIDQIEDIMSHDLLKSIDKANSITGKLHFLQIHLIYNFLRADYKKSLTYSVLALELFEKHLKAIRKPEEYMVYLQNALTSALFNKNYSLVTELFQKIGQNNSMIQTDGDTHKILTIEMQANWFIAIGNIEDGLELIAKNIKWIEESKQETSFVYQSFAVISYLAKNYNDALQFLDIILDKENKLTKPKHIALLLKLYVYFDTQELSLLESHLRSIYRKFYLNKEDYKIELMIVNGFKRLMQSNKRDVLSIMQKLHQDITHFQKRTTKEENRLIQNSGILFWLDRKIKHQSL